MKEPTKNLHFVSLGCPKNLVDSEIMLKKLIDDGYTVTDDATQADAFVVNTCSFIEEAKEESLEKIFELAQLKDHNPNKKLLVTGCLVQRYGQELLKELPEADALLGSGEFQNIATILKDINGGSEKRDYFYLPTFLQDELTSRVNTQPGHRAYLKISEGCLKRCSFCAIPKIRGNLQSRSLKAIVSEAKLLAAGGVKELNIVSHDFTDFGWDLRRQHANAVETPEAVLAALSEVDGIEWVRVLYLYPDGISDEMIDLIQTRKKLVKYFDMPLQHASDRMLKAMNRKMTQAAIQERLDTIRHKIPDAVIRTQFIVGFPGETEEDFATLLKFIEKNRFDRVGCFQYSQEENTPAGRMDQQVDRETKEKRYHQVMALQKQISFEKHQRFVGKTLPVLIEGLSEESELLIQGRTSQQAADIDGVVLITEGQGKVGDIVNVEITESHEYDLVGRIIDSPKRL